MKNRNRSLFLMMLCVGTFWLGQQCKKREYDLLLGGSTKGIWAWVSTTTPTRVLTSQSVGYSKQLTVLSDNQGAYVGFYKNDTLQRRINETVTDTAHTFIDAVRNTVLIKYRGAGYLKYYILTGNNGETLTVSELLNPYTTSADTVRTLYKRTSKTLYPY